MPTAEQIAKTATAELRAAKARPEWPKGTEAAWSEVEAVIRRCLEHPTPGKAVVHRKRNDLLDSLILVCGGNPESTTRAAFQTAAVALRDIKEVSPDLTPEMLVTGAHSYKRKHRDWALTVGSLAKYWGELGVGANDATRAAKKDIYTEPPGWRAVLQELYGLHLEAVNEKEWADLSPDTRRDLLAKIYPNAR